MQLALQLTDQVLGRPENQVVEGLFLVEGERRLGGPAQVAGSGHRGVPGDVVLPPLAPVVVVAGQLVEVLLLLHQPPEARTGTAGPAAGRPAGAGKRRFAPRPSGPSTRRSDPENDVLDTIPPPVYFEALTGEAVPHHGRVHCPIPDHDDRHPSARASTPIPGKGGIVSHVVVVAPRSTSPHT